MNHAIHCPPEGPEGQIPLVQAETWRSFLQWPVVKHVPVRCKTETHWWRAPWTRECRRGGDRWQTKHGLYWLALRIPQVHEEGESNHVFQYD